MPFAATQLHGARVRKVFADARARQPLRFARDFYKAQGGRSVLAPIAAPPCPDMSTHLALRLPSTQPPCQAV